MSVPDDSDPESQAERRRVLINDARVRDQQSTGTYLSHTHSELGGRFALTEHQTITGVVSPAPPQLPSNSPWHGPDPVPDEPPLGYDVNALPIESSMPHLIEDPGAPVAEAPPSEVAPPSADAVETSTGAPPSSKQAGGE